MLRVVFVKRIFGVLVILFLILGVGLIYFKYRGAVIYDEIGRVIEYGISDTFPGPDGTVIQSVVGVLIWPVYQENGIHYMNIWIPGRGLRPLKLALGPPNTNNKFSLFSGTGIRLSSTLHYNIEELININRYLRIGDRVKVRLIVGLEENYLLSPEITCDERCVKITEYLLHEHLGQISPMKIEGYLNTLEVLR